MGTEKRASFHKPVGALFLAQEKDESRLLYDMGRETANIHFGSPKAIAHVERDLTSRRSHWAAQSRQKPCTSHTQGLGQLAAKLKKTA